MLTQGQESVYGHGLLRLNQPLSDPLIQLVTLQRWSIGSNAAPTHADDPARGLCCLLLTRAGDLLIGAMQSVSFRVYTP